MADNPQIGRALSGLLQAVLAQELTGDAGAAADALLLEYANDLGAAAARGHEGLAEFLGSAWTDMMCAALELMRRGIVEHQDDPRVYLPAMIREQRKADRS